MADDWDEDRTSPHSGSVGSVSTLPVKKTKKQQPIGFIHFPDKPKRKRVAQKRHRQRRKPRA